MLFRTKILLLTLICSFFCIQVYAKEKTIKKQRLVHEAIMTKSGDSGLILQSIALSPPLPVNETPPPKCHDDAIWIPGYWAWLDNEDKFSWVSGTWRRPPTGHIWISGYWNKFPKGWAWVRGFWSPLPIEKISYIPKKPKEPVKEIIPKQPGKNYFWIPGYWAYNTTKQDYNWLSGVWNAMDPNWIYIPAYYLWRPEGYIFIPGYWDFILASRGCAYKTGKVEPGQNYTPEEILDEESIISSCAISYPDYSTFFEHNWYYNSGYWTSCGCRPPWWGWDGWEFGWSDNWWLWWWWTHPGFPNPPWITIDISDLLPPPPIVIINTFEGILPPIIIAPWGLISPWDWIDLLGQIPVIPNLPEDLDQILDELVRNAPRIQPLFPKGDPSESTPIPGPHINIVTPSDNHLIPPIIPSRHPKHEPEDEIPVLPPTHIPIPQPPDYPHDEPEDEEPTDIIIPPSPQHTYPRYPPDYPPDYTPTYTTPPIYINPHGGGWRGGHRGGHHGGGHHGGGKGGHHGGGHHGGKGGHHGGRHGGSKAGHHGGRHGGSKAGHGGRHGGSKAGHHGGSKAGHHGGGKKGQHGGGKKRHHG